MQELVWMVVNQCDFSTGKKPLNIRSPFLEQVTFIFFFFRHLIDGWDIYWFLSFSVDTE